eukprot:1137770-Pelagomonas_calceolata.AAC.12
MKHTLLTQPHGTLPTATCSCMLVSYVSNCSPEFSVNSLPFIEIKPKRVKEKDRHLPALLVAGARLLSGKFSKQSFRSTLHQHSSTKAAQCHPPPHFAA